MASANLTLRVTAVACEAKDIAVVELRSPDGSALPPFTAGAHVELRLANGLLRHYSLCNDPRETARYRIAVALAPESRGGSRFVHGALRVGDMLQVGTPRNHFPLAQDTSRHHFIAGGIGVTPMLAMVQHCEASGAPWTLSYLVRSRQRAAFLEELSAYGSRVQLHADDEAGGPMQLERLLCDVDPETAIYCCGPASLMDAVAQATRQRPAGRVHFEWFAAKTPADTAVAGAGFQLRLARSGTTIDVAAEVTMLEALEANGVQAPWACREGICGSCEVAVLSGIPDHRDTVLSPLERAANRSVMTCCSRALSPVLELDL